MRLTSSIQSGPVYTFLVSFFLLFFHGFPSGLGQGYFSDIFEGFHEPVGTYELDGHQYVWSSESGTWVETDAGGQTGLSDGTEARDWGYSGINHDYIQRTYGPWHHHQPEYETSSSHVPPVSYGSSPPRVQYWQSSPPRFQQAEPTNSWAEIQPTPQDYYNWADSRSDQASPTTAETIPVVREHNQSLLRSSETLQQCQRYSAKISDRPPQQAKLLNLFSYGVQQFTATDRYIIGDGNCQSRALSYWRFGTQDRHADVRKAIYNLVKTGRYKDSLEKGTLRKFNEAQAKDGVWGDEQTLAAAAEVYKKRIILLSLASPNKPYFVEYGKAYSVDPKRPGLIFWNNPYELLFFQGNRRKFDRI